MRTVAWFINMSAPPVNREGVLLCLVGAAMILTVISITAFEILMCLAFLSLVATRTRPRLPPNWIPLALFMMGTLVSLAASGQLRQGIPQIRKFYIYLMLILVTTVLQSVRQIQWIFRAWTIAAAVAAAWGLIQFTYKYKEAHQPFYNYYIGNRITGFTNHWMTFSGEMMIALLVTAAAVLFSAERRWTTWLVCAVLLITGALAGAWTRSMWFGAFCGGVYLIWVRKPWAL